MNISDRDHAEALYYHIAGDAIETAARKTMEAEEFSSSLKNDFQNCATHD
jgi:hypothetical protein